jgi:AbrB family looped-hinge helix DNA binding protein
MTTKGQITVPKEFRDAFGWKPGDQVGFVKDGDGVRLVRPSALSRGAQALAALRRTKLRNGLTTDEMLRDTRSDV